MYSKQVVKSQKKSQSLSKLPKILTSNLKEFPNLYSTTIGLFVLNFFTQCAPKCRDFENKIKTAETFQSFKSALWGSQKCSNRNWAWFERMFLETFITSVLIGKKWWKDFEKYEKVRKRFLMSSKIFFVSNLRWFLRKCIFTHYTMECGDSQSFQKNRKSIKFSQLPKKFPESVQTYFEHDLTWVLRTNFLKHCFLECRDSQGNKKKWKLIKVPYLCNKFPKSDQTKFEPDLMRLFQKKFYRLYFRVQKLEKFSRRSKNFNLSETAQIGPQNLQTCFEHDMRWVVQEKFLPTVP